VDDRQGVPVLRLVWGLPLVFSTARFHQNSMLPAIHGKNGTVGNGTIGLSMADVLE
jgi:hypothetical protein